MMTDPELRRPPVRLSPEERREIAGEKYPDTQPVRVMSGKELLRNRAASFRYAADQIDRLLGMTPADLTAEQEQALLFLGQNTQFVF